MLNGLDLFSGIGGISIALEPWVRTVAYCESDRYAQGVLLSRMRSDQIDRAPIWDDVQTLRAEYFETPIDIIFGGFPCQDISVAGRGAGLEGKRSGLFFEIMRLVYELRPTFVFLENVPAIVNRGLGTVAGELTDLGYDCRWTIVSAKELGARHQRKRWFLLGADANGIRELQSQGIVNEFGRWPSDIREDVAYAVSRRHWFSEKQIRTGRIGAFDSSGWSIEPNVGRVDNGIQSRVDRLRCLGNAVVPIQAREAFQRLIGMKDT